MITKDSIESAYCFFHQKWRVYEFSTSLTQKDDIEFAISKYVESMNRELYDKLAKGNPYFLLSHLTFAADISGAVDRLEDMMGEV